MIVNVSLALAVTAEAMTSGGLRGT